MGDNTEAPMLELKPEMLWTYLYMFSRPIYAYEDLQIERNQFIKIPRCFMWNSITLLCLSQAFHSLLLPDNYIGRVLKQKHFWEIPDCSEVNVSQELADSFVTPPLNPSIWLSLPLPSLKLKLTVRILLDLSDFLHIFSHTNISLIKSLYTIFHLYICFSEDPT